MPQRSKYVDDRLHRWGCWATAGGQVHSAGVSSIYLRGERVEGSDWDGSVSWSHRVMFDNLEAEETNKAVFSLDPDNRRIVHRVYIQGIGGTMEQHARSMKMSRKGLFLHLCQVDDLILAWLGKKPEKVAA